MICRLKPSMQKNALNVKIAGQSIATNLSVMKTKIMRLALFTLLMISAQFIYAQDRSNEDRAKSLTERMKQNLSLKDDQYEKAYTINLAFVNKASQVRNGGGGRLSKARKL